MERNEFYLRSKLTDLDCVDEISDDALVYYLPALMFMIVKDPDWLIYHGPLELKILGLLGKFSLAQINVIIAYADFIVRYERATSSDDVRSRESSQPMIDTFENFKKHILMYLDEMGSLLKRREERQANGTNTSS